MENTDNTVRDLDHLAELFQTKNLPYYLREDWRGENRFSPFIIRPETWFWRNQLWIAIASLWVGLFWAMSIYVFDLTSTPELYAALVSLLAVLLMIPILKLKPPREKAWKEIQPFVSALEELLRTNELTFKELGSFSKQEMRLHVQTNIVRKCRLIIECREGNVYNPPSPAMDVMAQDLQRELGEVYDAGKMFRLVSPDGYGLYFSIAEAVDEADMFFP